MKHQSLIEHLNLPPGYDTEVAEKAVERYFDNAKLWYKAEGWDNGYFSRDKEILFAKIAFCAIGFFLGMLVTVFTVL